MQFLVNSFSKPFIVFHTNYLICFSFNNKKLFKKAPRFEEKWDFLHLLFLQTYTCTSMTAACPILFPLYIHMRISSSGFFLSRTSVILERTLMNKIPRAEPIPNSVTINWLLEKKIKVFSRPWKNSMTLKKKFLTQFKLLVVQSICVCVLNDYNHFPES